MPHFPPTIHTIKKVIVNLKEQIVHTPAIKTAHRFFSWLEHGRLQGGLIDANNRVTYARSCRHGEFKDTSMNGWLKQLPHFSPPQ